MYKVDKPQLSLMLIAGTHVRTRTDTAYKHRRQGPLPTGFRQEGPSEVYILASKLATMVEGESNEGEAI